MSILRNPAIGLVICLIGYGMILAPFSSYMRAKPVEEKLGYLPSSDVLKYMAADHKEVLGASLIMKVIVYFGGIVEKQQTNVIVEPPDYRRMSGILHGAVKLDPLQHGCLLFCPSVLDLGRQAVQAG